MKCIVCGRNAVAIKRGDCEATFCFTHVPEEDALKSSAPSRALLLSYGMKLILMEV